MPIRVLAVDDEPDVLRLVEVKSGHGCLRVGIEPLVSEAGGETVDAELVIESARSESLRL